MAAAIEGFISDPAQWELLRREPARARVAFDKAIGWASPVQTFLRTATADVHLGDVVIPAGERILMFLGAAPMKELIRRDIVARG